MGLADRLAGLFGRRDASADAERPRIGADGERIREPEPWWPDPPAALDGPNVLPVVPDDTGFGHFGCYDTEVATPVVDWLAAGDLR
jgi:hypothetical protein